ncbi:spore gernimation protein [Pueribacillus theae]|uniref:Spore gernimation protein n=1 Tax=Pueribacillus theae TaxID=2171751 RepID=A0A2U1K3Y7_9BACI|nr:endospore germination permease [Pueribacillus theae]PWA12237.1 spore gernimation protein [Pueribacillus theae]
MPKSEKISSKQLIILIFLYSIGSSVIIIPTTLASQAKQDAWIAGIVGLVFSIFIVILYTRLFSLFPNFTLVELAEHLLGRWIGKLISLLFIGFFVILTALILRNIGDFLTIQIMPETPIVAILILFIFVSLIGVRHGLEVLSRAAEIFLPWVVIQLFIFVLFLIPQIEFSRIEPIFEYGFKPIMSGALPFISIPFSELVVFLMILPYLNEKKNAGKSLLIGATMGGIVLILITILAIFVLGADITARNTYPTYLLGKKISIANYLERIEVIVAIIWFLTIFFKLSICFYASVLGMAQTFKLSDYRSLLSPISIILVILSLILAPNIGYLQKVVLETWPPFSMAVGIFIPFLLYIIAKFRGKSPSLQKSNKH